MLGSKLILLLALIGQTPGAVSPTSPAVAPKPTPKAATAITATQARQWFEAVNQADGKTYQISGWLDADGTPRFDPREYPQFVAATKPTPPAPEPINPGPKPDWPFPQLGVVQSKIPKPVAGQAWYGGNAVKVIEAGVEAPKAKPPDVHLTLIGVEAEQVKARARLQADPKFRAIEAAMGDRLAVQYYSATDPMVARVGLVDGGKPDVVIQDSTGKERKRFHADPGPESIVAEIRKADPAYKPGKDDEPGQFQLSGPALFCLMVGAGIAGLLLKQHLDKGRP